MVPHHPARGTVDRRPGKWQGEMCLFVWSSYPTVDDQGFLRRMARADKRKALGILVAHGGYKTEGGHGREFDVSSSSAAAATDRGMFPRFVEGRKLL